MFSLCTISYICELYRCCFVFFFFKQKTAYEMRISDWSSDVCSSDLIGEALTRYLAEDGIRVIGGIEYHAAEKTESGIRLRARQNGQTVALDAERVLIATGRTPNIEGLGLEEAGIAVDGSRGIAVDRSEEHTSELQSLMRISYAV